jgi:hypothetical protein
MSDNDSWEEDFEPIPASWVAPAQLDSFEPITDSFEPIPADHDTVPECEDHPLSSAFVAFEERLAAQDERAAQCRGAQERAARALASAAADSADLAGQPPPALVGLLLRIADALDVVGEELERGRRQCEDLADEHEQTKAQLELLRLQYQKFVHGP